MLKSSKITLIKKADSLNIEGNYLEITQVFYNLIENGIKYGNQNSDVIIEIIQNDLNYVIVSVINEAEGIPEKYLDRVTERFYRVDKARSRKIGGTGLGLAIVKHILIKHRAELKIESVPNEKTKFSVIFPLAKKKIW